MQCLPLHLKRIYLSRMVFFYILKAMKKFISIIIFTLCLIPCVGLNAVSIQTTNRILTTVGETSITVLDVKKEMDRQIYMQDRDLFKHPENVYTYYAQNWKLVLQKLTNDELLLLESKKNKYEVSAYDINQKQNELFGDEQVEAFRFLALTPEQAYEYSKRDLISQHITWYNVWSKAFMRTTPSDVKKAYEEHVASLPKKDEWTYQTLYVKGNNEKKVQDAASNISALLEDKTFANLSALLESSDLEESGLKVGVSKDITLKTGELSPTILGILESLEAGKMSEVITAKRDDSYTGKVLHLKGFKKEPIPEFASMSEQIKSGLMNDCGGKIANDYFEKLYKQYDVHGLCGTSLKMSQLTPFMLQDD